MSGGLINDPKHWRARAGEARRLAVEMQDEVSKQMMLGVAADYDGFAERAELRAKDNAKLTSAASIERMTVEDRHFR